MSQPTYDAAHISGFYDAYGEQEWERMVAGPRQRVSFAIHQHYLARFIEAGDAVLEAGAGPGRFTIELARLGARVTVGDISPAQLALHAQKSRDAGIEASVVIRDVLDIVDLSRYPSAAFDAVVCYGGPLSYVFDRADEALAEMLRVTKPGGHVLLSVMSLLGTSQLFFPAILGIAAAQGLETVEQVNQTGDLTNQQASPNGHYCRMYRWSRLNSLLKRHPCEIIAASASNFLSMRDDDELLAQVAANPALWEAFVRWELDFCQEPGALDGGTHILAVVRKS
ncbi:MAG: hypothetical protein OJF49_003096 [Ktedonobacterales bacterium]|nr:MAG: hypothetical protein OJF49_003096 [Ktedonobacterales bacterium]